MSTIESNMQQIERLCQEISGIAINNMSLDSFRILNYELMSICRLTGSTMAIAESLTEVKK